MFSGLIKGVSIRYWSESQQPNSGRYGFAEAEAGLIQAAERLNVIARWFFKTFFMARAAQKIVADNEVPAMQKVESPSTQNGASVVRAANPILSNRSLVPFGIARGKR